MSPKTILIDGREFVPGKRTGIGRFLEGLLEALVESDLEILLAVSNVDAVPYKFHKKKKTKLKKLPLGFLAAERTLTVLTRQAASLFLSPYPKLPLFGIFCRSLHTIHDVLDLTHPPYIKRVKATLDRFRLQSALRQASLTWYVSHWSLKETERCIGLVGKNPRVRHPAVDERFKMDPNNNEDFILKKYNLQAGYILVIGNGLPHKNLGVLLEIADMVPRKFVFIGVSEKNRKYWQSRYYSIKPKWIEHVCDEDLPAVIRGAYCLAQPSTAEGYGYPPLEAMASGVPCVISNIPVLVETTGGNALTSSPSSPKDWMHVIETLEDTEIYKSQVDKGLRWVEPLRGITGWQKHLSDLESLLFD